MGWSLSRRRDIHYSYDDNGSLTEKITAIKDEPDPQTYFEEKVTSTYNLQNRLAQIVRQYDDAGDTIEEFTEYTYNDGGIRVSKHTWSEINDTHQNDDVTVVYLVDSYNHTGYAQVLEEMTFNKADPDPLTETPDSLTTYVIGDDVIAQTKDGTTQYLLYDGHGSTRQLAEYDSAVSIANTFSYDGYGVLLQDDAVASSNPGKVGTQATNLLYAGEQFDVDAQMYYLRARYYDQNNGRFNRIDPFAGNNRDPQSLHKYLYAHCNPIMNADPSGEMTMGNLIAFTIVAAIFVTILAIAIGPPLYRLHRVSTLMRHSEIMDSHILEGAISAGDRYWSGNKSWKKLRLFVNPDEINPLTVMVTPLDRRIGGFHLYYKQGYVFVSQNAVDDGALSTAFTIFAEWTHDRWLGGGLNEEQAQEDIDILIELLPEEERHGDFIGNYGHGWF